MGKTYVNRYVVTKELYLDRVNHPIRNGKGGSTKLIRSGLVVTTAGIAVYYFIADNIVYALFFLAIAFICLFGAFLLTVLNASREFKKLAAFHGVPSWERVIRFTEDKIFMTDGRLKSEYSYSSITGFVNKKDYYALRFKSGSYLRVYKNGFRKRGADDFFRFLKTKLPAISCTVET